MRKSHQDECPNQRRFSSQVANAIAFGASGIGLCRTEHMFFEGNRIDAMRQMILADNEVDRRKALKKLLPYQRRDFQGIFKALEGRPQLSGYWTLLCMNSFLTIRTHRGI